MLIELFERAYDAFLPDVHDEGPFLRKVVRRLGESGVRLGKGGRLGSLATGASACHMSVRVRVSNAGRRSFNDGRTIAEF